MEHAFRPEFTTEIIRGLKKADSFNLIGDTRSGRSRLLVDIRAGLPDCQVALVNMHEFKGYYNGFVWEVARQFAVQDCKHLGDIANHVLQNQGRRFVFLLDSFESILGVVAKDIRYDTNFLGELNNLKNIDNINLCVVTQKPYLDYTLSTEKEWVTLSQLNLGLKKIPPSTTEEIRNEINRQVPGLDPLVMDIIIRDFSRPYEVLALILARIQRTGMPEDPQKVFSVWRRESQRERSASLERSLVKLNHWMEKWKGLGKPIWFLLGLLTGLSGGAFGQILWGKISWIWQYLLK